VLTFVGTRPEAIKLAPVIKALARAEGVISEVCAVGQHREMLQQALDVFEIVPEYRCRVMRPDQSLASLTARLAVQMDRVVAEASPDWILAQGDTTTVMVASLVAFYRGVRFGHVEAGLRTGHLRQPFPEELNRRIADLVASAYFAPTPGARTALLAEGCDSRLIYVTGNTIVDALHDVIARPYAWDRGPLAVLDPDAPLALITAHRRESFGAPLSRLCAAISEIASRYPEVRFVYPVHLNPSVRRTVLELLGHRDNIVLLEPLDYVSLVQLMRRARLVLTDSGGLQEEAPSLGVPVLVLRERTERPEGLAMGLVRLVGTEVKRIVAEAQAILDAAPAARRGALHDSPYGDGRAAARIVAVLTGAVREQVTEAVVPASA
jgi:UDP-N-acetylglucosamine 2-epimerase